MADPTLTIEDTSGPTGASCGGTPPNTGGEYQIEVGSCLACYAGKLNLPEEGNTLAPWVAITFEGSGSVITVGNDSSTGTDPKNIACIKSFEFGHSDGLTMRCVIHDEEGGSFVAFMKHLFKDYVCLKNGMPAAVRLKVQFGWVKAGCSTPLPLSASRCYYCLSDSVETNYAQGKFMFDITGKDLCHRMFEGSTDQIYGGTGDKGVPITTAIREFMTKGCSPNVGKVDFCKMEDGQRKPCAFLMKGKTGDDKFLGPKGGPWAANGQDKMKVAMRWLEGFPTEDNRGWIPQYNCEEPNGELIFWQDAKPLQPQDSAYWDKNSIGTYIVNGGKRSSVIEFNPKIRWDFARLTSQGGNLGSGTINALNTPGSTQPGMTQSGLSAQNQPCAGQNTQTTPTEAQKDISNKKQQVNQAEGNNAAIRALKILTDNIEADLTIVGDPTLLPPSEAMWAKNVAIILINPYFIRTDADGQLEWMAQPACNEVLSNKAWICKSITHKIEAGNFTTTIGVFLTTPGADTENGSPLGAWKSSGGQCGGWIPVPQCSA